jgi:shikimate dehydrogenase
MKRPLLTITAKTQVYGVMGDPVSHSLSPVMHNRAFSHTGLDAVYTAFRVTDVASAVSGIRALGIRGVSVTIPHKVSVISHLDDLDEQARFIGAVNTIMYRENILTGYNTDSWGAVSALEEKITLGGRQVAVIGAGGASRAIAFGLSKCGADVTIVNRTPSTAERLASEFGLHFQPLSDFKRGQCEVLINTTPVGMTPNRDCMPVSSDILEEGMVVMDIVYHPLETKLLKTAKARRCTVIDGLSMFVFQGAKQFELWTGQKAPVRMMRNAVLKALESKV